jgi:quinol monooxygenase YgiN
MSSTAAPSLTLSFVAKLVAGPETADELSGLLGQAHGMAEAEPGTVMWFALRTDDTTFWIVDAFGSEDDRRRHIEGPIAEALPANADRLLAEPPNILPADVLAAKLPA